MVDIRTEDGEIRTGIHMQVKRNRLGWIETEEMKITDMTGEKIHGGENADAVWETVMKVTGEDRETDMVNGIGGNIGTIEMMMTGMIGGDGIICLWGCRN